MAATEVKVGGAAGGLAALCRGVGSVAFAMLAGIAFARHRIPSWAKLLAGAIVSSSVVGVAIGIINLGGFSEYEGQHWEIRAWQGALIGLGVGLLIGIFLMLITEDGVRKKIREMVDEVRGRNRRLPRTREGLDKSHDGRD